MTAFPTSKQFLGIAKEVTKGTAVTPPTDYVPIRTIGGGRNIVELTDTSLRGSAVEEYSSSQGVWVGDFMFDGDVFADTIGFPLKGILGDEVITGAGAPYAHAFSVLNSGDQQPPSWTLVDSYGVAVRAYPGAQFSELTFKFDDNSLLMYSAKAQTLADSILAAPTPSYGTLSPLPAWTGSLQIGGVAAYPLSGEWSLKRKIAPIHTQDGVQNPRHIWVGGITATGKMKLLMENDTYYSQFLADTQPILAHTFTLGAGAALTSVVFTASKAKWTAAPIDRGKEFVTLDLSFRALGNTTDVGASAGYSNLKVTVNNARATAY